MKNYKKCLIFTTFCIIKQSLAFVNFQSIKKAPYGCKTQYVFNYNWENWCKKGV